MNIMANANPDMDRFSNCKVCNEQTTKTTILKHMNRKKTLINNVLKTCKEHDIEEFNSIKDSIFILRKAQKREYQRGQYQTNGEIKRLKQNQYDLEHREEKRQKQGDRREKQQNSTDLLQRFIKFKQDIIDGPNFTCHSCNRQLFKKQVKFLNQEDMSNLKTKYKLQENFLLEVGLNVNFDIYLCHTCLRVIRLQRVPNINVRNGLQLDDVPEALDIKDLEQQLIARTLLFIKIKRLPTTRMKASIDNIINVPIECTKIYQNFHETQRILKLFLCN